MIIAVAGGEDRRQRYRFVVEPLRAAGYMVEQNPLGLTVGLRRLSSLGRQLQALVLVGLGPKMVPLVWWARRRGVPVIARLGGDPERDMQSRISAAWARGRWLFWLKGRVTLAARRWLLVRMDGLIVVNESLVSLMAARLGTSVPISVVPQFCPGEGRPRGYDLGDTMTLLSVSNLDYPAKAEGVLWLVDRLAERPGSGEGEMRFRIAGGGAHLADVRAGLERRDLPAGLNVDVLGFVEDVETQYREADLFLYHSVHDGTPNTLLEAKRFALPTLTNDCEEFSTIVENGVSGLLYRDEADFHAAFSRLLDDPDLRQTLGSHALNDHLNRFSVAAAARNLEAALAGLNIPVSARSCGGRS